MALLLLGTSWILLPRSLLPLPGESRLGDRGVLRSRLQALGTPSAAEWRVAVGFLITCLLWVFRKKIGLPPAVHDSTIAAGMVIVFFLVPSGASQGQPKRLLEWSDSRDLPWGLLLLFGGGIALSAAFKTSGLTSWMGSRLEFLTDLHVVVMIAGLCLVVTMLTEITSNTATTAMMLPIVDAVAEAINDEHAEKQQMAPLAEGEEEGEGVKIQLMIFLPLIWKEQTNFFQNYTSCYLI